MAARTGESIGAILRRRQYSPDRKNQAVISPPGKPITTFKGLRERAHSLELALFGGAPCKSRRKFHAPPYLPHLSEYIAIRKLREAPRTSREF